MALNAPKVDEIIFERNAVGSRTCAALAQWLRFNESLHTLDLHENPVDDAGAVAIGKALTRNSALATLRLSKTELTTGGMGSFFESLTCNFALKHLTLEVSTGTLNPGINLPPLKGLVPAENIDLSARSYGPLSAVMVCKFIEAYRPAVAALAIDKNAILAEGAAALGEMLKDNDDIRMLDVRFCALGPEGITAIAEGLKVNTSVEKLLALTNHLGADSIEPMRSLIEHSTSLKYIDVQDNLFPPQGKKALREAADQKPGLVLVL